MRRLRGDHGVKVGLPVGSNDYPDTGESVINVGFWHEFGTRRLPERSWMRSAIRANVKKYKTAIKKGLLEIQKGKLKPAVLLGRLGLSARDDMRAMIDALPLVDTGHLKQSTTWQVLD